MDLLWKQVLDVVRVSVSSATFSTWFAQTFIVNIKNAPDDSSRQIVEIGCPSSYIRDQLERRYFGLLQDSLLQLTGKANDPVFSVKQKPRSETTTSPLFSKEDEDALLSARFAKSGLPSGFTFENFAVSSSNQFAWAASCAVAKKPGTTYNPLFIWGGVGVGKTHLIIAIAHEILKNLPHVKVLYCTGEDFMVEIINAIRTKTTSEFKKRFRGVDVLLIDDIQFIAGKPTAQEEFFHTFNVIQKTGGQIILTSDKPPGEIVKLADRLRSRFEAGLIVDIGPPDFELRAAILLIKAKSHGIVFSPKSVELIASSISSARSIEGFLIRLQSQAQLNNNPITDGLIERLIAPIKEGNSEGGGSAKNHVSPQDVLGTVCLYFSINKKTLLSPTRVKNIVLPRQILMYLLRTELKLPLQEIGDFLGGRDHTTIIHGITKISSSTNTEEIKQHLQAVKRELWG